MNNLQNQDEFSLDESVQKWRLLTANDGVLLGNEFQNLRQYDPTRTTIATNPKNKSKNRYTSVYPYDEDFCRVRLPKKTHDQSDYINASIIRLIPPDQISSSIPNSRVFYAAQGPVEQTLDDFIRMIIEYQIGLIVMLSFVYDPITSTFAQEHTSYFSDTIQNKIETKFFIISTTMICPGYRHIARRLQIKVKSSDFVYQCDQYHYPHFMDKGTPNDCHSLISLVMKLRREKNPNDRILVHCNAGVGRTGVFITLYYLFDALERQEKFNVKKIVDTIRLYRPHLVQTIEQYQYIYRCLAEIAIHPYDERILDQFVEYVNKSVQHLSNSPVHCAYQNRNLRVELDTYLTTISAQQYPNCNRNNQFIPYDQNRVILHSPSECTYINASKIASPFATGAIILTQEPMKNTLQPFFAMLLQEHKTFIVAVEEIEKPKYVENKFISHSAVTMDILNVCRSNNKFGNYHRSYRIQVKDNVSRECDVFIFEYLGQWTTDGTCLPTNLEQFIRFVDRSIYHQRKIDSTRLGLVVHDRDGGSKAAFYCIVQNLLDRLLLDDRITLENSVTDVCQRRINALISPAQYIALHQIVALWSHLKRRGALECPSNTIRN